MASRNHDRKRSGTDLDAADVLRARFKRHPVAQLDELSQALRVSGRTVFRVLERVGYLSSFSHAGRFYTLVGVPTFDEQGLWFHGDVGFSAAGTLRLTLERMVKQAPAGRTHLDLQALVRLRVHDTLRSLVEARRIKRELIEALYVYLDIDAKVAKAQLARRHELLATRAAEPPLEAARVIEVLLAVIRRPHATAREVAAELRARGLAPTDAQVEAVFTRYELGKKTARSPSRPSPR
jgi:hypothetical protein